MKKLAIFTVSSLIACASVWAQNTLPDASNPAYQAMLNVTDSALVFPESMSDSIDTLNFYNWTERYFVHFDPECVSDKDVPPVPDSIYILRLRALPTKIDMPFNQPVRQCIDLFVHKRRELVERMAGIGYNYYFPIFEDALQRYGMPSELKYLACIESSLRINAYSRARAAGLWQFIPSSAMLQGLEINSFIDERYDLYKSTDAACRFLLQLYNIFGDWHLAIAAYNCGPGNIRKAMIRSGGKRTFWEIYNFLPRETRSYVPLFIAATYIMNYHCEHNMCTRISEVPPVCDTLMLNTMVNFEQISQVLNMPKTQIESLNPQYVFDIVPGSPEKAYALTLPQERALSFIELQDSIFAYKADSLLPHNGDLKEIPARGKRNSYIKGGGYGGVADSNGIYRVRKGDTLGGIAYRNHTSVAKLKKLNGLKSDRLSIGQRLRVR
ncbi:MAG: transglycosylase SLT domain-containing protein [Bacteroidales bacterium]|nr:transglycosylase SLT domain-containing protein [Bacteroidales bacterium]MBP5681185.1 transglycosylase SLT domain-containing protein [Bacteroidales bacterium]